VGIVVNSWLNVPLISAEVIASSAMAKEWKTVLVLPFTISITVTPPASRFSPNTTKSVVPVAEPTCIENPVIIRSVVPLPPPLNGNALEISVPSEWFILK